MGAWMDKAREGKDLYATFDTTEGKIVVKLFAKDAPKTVENFVGLATGEKVWNHPADNARKENVPLYDGTIFHRCIGDFMVQGGDPLGKGFGGPGYKFADEFQSGKKFDKPYLLAMANSGPATNGSQFFITAVPTPHLNGKHTIFGRVTKGQDVVDTINALGTDAGTPSQPVYIESVAIAEA